MALAALADQFSARTTSTDAAIGIEPAFFYALFRAGVPANEKALYRVDPKAVEGVWEQALKQGVIPAALRTRLSEAKEAFGQIAWRQLLEAPAMAGLSSFKELIALSLSDSARQQQIADLYVRHRQDLPAFWVQVKETLGETTAKRLMFDGQLAYLTLNNAPMIAKLHAASGEGGLTDSLQLVARGFYRAANWAEIIEDDALPPEISGADDAEKRSNYAELLAAQIRLSFPTATVAQMVLDEQTPLSSADLRTAVHAFLMEHESSFEIGRQPIAQYVASHDLDMRPHGRGRDHPHPARLPDHAGRPVDEQPAAAEH